MQSQINKIISDMQVHLVKVVHAIVNAELTTLLLACFHPHSSSRKSRVVMVLPLVVIKFLSQCHNAILKRVVKG